MKRSQMIWLVVFVLAALFLIFRAATTGMGSSYVREVKVDATDQNGDVHTWYEYKSVIPRLQTEPDVFFSLPRTVGVWIAAFITLAIYSFLWGDNIFYKLAESLMVGVSAAYLMVQTYWQVIVPNLEAKLSPALVRNTIDPKVAADAQPEWAFLVPLLLGVMLVWRLAPKGAWIARWPLAFFIGATAGFRLVNTVEADFVRQLQSTIKPLLVTIPNADPTLAPDINGLASLNNFLIVASVLACLTYFFFSIEHKGAVGKFARVGIWVLMIAFGASFGYTVMARISLLAARLEFLFDDWLWILDSTGSRALFW